MPTFVTRLSGLSVKTVTTLLLVPALISISAILLNGWHSDKTRERRFHAAIPLQAAGLMFGLAALTREQPMLAIFFLLIGSGIVYAYAPAIWAIPTMMLSRSVAAATYGLINSLGQLGGLVGPWLIGAANERTHSPSASFILIMFAYFMAGSLIIRLRIPDLMSGSQGSPNNVWGTMT